MGPFKAAVPAAIGAAGSIAGGLMGGKGGKPSHAQNLLAQQQAGLIEDQRRIANREAKLVKPLRGRTAEILQGFLDTGITPEFLDLPATVTPTAALSLPVLGAQQSALQRDLVNQGIRGGQLQQALANAATQGALQRTQLLQNDALRQEARDVARSEFRQRLFGGAGDFAQGGLNLAFQGLGNAANAAGLAAQSLNQQQALAAQRANLVSQGTGQLLGKGLGGLFAGGGAGFENAFGIPQKTHGRVSL